MRNDMRNKRPLNLTLEPEIIAWLDKIMEKRHYTSRSILVEELIRERYDQVFGTKIQPQKEVYPTPRAELNELRDLPRRSQTEAGARKKTGT